MTARATAPRSGRETSTPRDVALQLGSAGERLRTTLLYPSRSDARTVEQMLAMFTSDGHEAYVCGGSVRDSLLGLDVSDVDLVVNLPIDQVRLRLVEAFGEESVRLYNPKFGLVTVGKDAASAIDITMFHDPRDITLSDTFIMDVAFRHHGTIADDATSRDLTMNAVYWGPTHGFVDPSGQGLRDIATRRIRLAAAASKRRVDPRMSFRMLVFMSRGFIMTEEAEAFVRTRLEVDIESYPRDGFDAFIVETVHGRRDQAKALLELARPLVRKPSAWRRLESACQRV